MDLHHHLLWGVDDGPESQEVSLEMATMAAEEGITGIVMTPHYMKGLYENPVEDLLQKKRVLEEALAAARVPLTLTLGNEVFADLDTAREVKEGKILTLNASRYLLIEFPFSEIPPYEEEVVFQILRQGLVPIIAHPERINIPPREVGIFEDFIHRGCLLQVNTGSLMGFNGKEALARARYFLEHRMAHLLATDAHNTGARRPLMKEALARAAAWVGEEETAAMIQRARDIAADRGVRVNPPVKSKKKKLFFP